MKKHYNLHYPAWQIVLVVLYRMMIDPNKKIYVNKLARKVNKVLDSMYKYINSLEDKGFISSKKESKYRYITLTAQGTIIAQALNTVITQDVVERYREGEYFG